MTYATPADVAVALRGSTSYNTAEGIQWQSWLDRVERSIERRFKRANLVLADQVALEDPSAADVSDVEVEAVVRKVWNVKAAELVVPGTSKTRTVDDASVTDRNDSRTTIDYDPLSLTDAEWDTLLPDGEAAAFSTRPGFEPDCSLPEWWP